MVGRVWLDFKDVLMKVFALDCVLQKGYLGPDKCGKGPLDQTNVLQPVNLQGFEGVPQQFDGCNAQSLLGQHCGAVCKPLNSIRIYVPRAALGWAYKPCPLSLQIYSIACWMMQLEAQKDPDQPFDWHSWSISCRCFDLHSILHGRCRRCLAALAYWSYYGLEPALEETNR